MDTSNHGIDWDAVITELQKPNGWRQGSMGEWRQPDDAVCLWGAICRTVQSVDWTFQSAVTPIIREHFPERIGWKHSSWAVPEFNDHHDTTLDDVILVCEKARGSSWA
jgi:hypothetical protein